MLLADITREQLISFIHIRTNVTFLHVHDVICGIDYILERLGSFGYVYYLYGWCNGFCLWINDVTYKKYIVGWYDRQFRNCLFN